MILWSFAGFFNILWKLRRSLKSDEKFLCFLNFCNFPGFFRSLVILAPGEGISVEFFVIPVQLVTFIEFSEK